MRSTKISKTLKLNSNLEIEVEGFYTPEIPEVRYYPDGSGQPSEASELEITNITIIKGDLMYLIDNLNGNLDLWDYLTELTIKQIEER